MHNFCLLAEKKVVSSVSDNQILGNDLEKEAQNNNNERKLTKVAHKYIGILNACLLFHFTAPFFINALS